MEWIKVEDRLPDVEQLDYKSGYTPPKYTKVLVSTDYGVLEARYARLLLRKKEVLRFEGLYGAINGVVAWQPLPDPYKAD